MKLNQVLEIIDGDLAREAFTHPSCGEKINNQRLEFLGDAILGLIVSHWLFDRSPPLSEGDMSWLRAALVREETLAHIARQLELGGQLRLAKGAEKEGARNLSSALADSLEALIGALYLSAGMETTRQAVLSWMAPWLSLAESQGLDWDYKSRLQEKLQRGDVEFRYVLKRQQGPDHMKTFWVELQIGGKPVAVGRGSSKKEAEQDAARQALDNGI